jgi:hypothetical protein
MKPNLQFNLHKEASLLRDEATAKQAQEKFAIWRAVSAPALDQVPEQYKVESEVSSADYEFSAKAFLVTLLSAVSSRDSLTGTFYMNNQEICFTIPGSKSLRFRLDDLKFVLLRSYLHLETGIEFYLSSHRSYFFDFTPRDRQLILTKLSRLTLPNLAILQTNPAKDCISAFTERWREGQLSNYEYLILVNLLSGRSFNDLSQYPIFPWVLSNYESETLDLNDSANFRDLSSPLGALNQSRWDKIAMTLAELPPTDPDKYSFFRQHYSNPFYVCLYLIRIEPFTSIHIALCDKKFDKADRLFYSIARSYAAVTGALADFRELIPEFFTMPDFLVNHNDFDLGVAGADEPINDVILPPWAHGSAHEFIEIHRQALESPFVSSHLHEWINLIFGYKQTGPAAVEAKNTFHRSCYQNSITAEIRSDPDLLAEVQEVARNVGIVPRQIFDHPHPEKSLLSLIPTLSLYRLEVLHTFPALPRAICISANVLYLVDAECGVWWMRLSRKAILPLRIGSIHPYVTNRAETLPRSFLMLPDIGRFVATSSWDSSFHVFKIDPSNVVHVDSIRQKFSFLQTLTAGGSSFLLTSWRDSSIRLSDLSVPGTRYLYRITPHLTSIVDIDASPDARIIVSLDKSRKCVLSMLYTGKYIRSFGVDGSDVLEKVMLFSSGFIVVLSKIELPDVRKAIVRLYGLDTQKLAQVEFDDQVLDWTKAEFCCALDCIMISFVSKRCVFLEIPRLRMMLDIVTDEPFVMVKFCRAMDEFVAVAPDGKLWTFGV